MKMIKYHIQYVRHCFFGRKKGHARFFRLRKISCYLNLDALGEKKENELSMWKNIAGQRHHWNKRKKKVSVRSGTFLTHLLTFKSKILNFV